MLLRIIIILCSYVIKYYNIDSNTESILFKLFECYVFYVQIVKV